MSGKNRTAKNCPKIKFKKTNCSVDRNKYQIHIPLPPKIDPTVTMMQVEDKPDVTYSDVGGCKEQIEKLREVVETPLLHVCTLHHATIGLCY